MQQVQIANGIYRNDNITGTFKLVTRFRRSYTAGPKEGKIEILDTNNKRVGVWVDKNDFQYLSDDGSQIQDVSPEDAPVINTELSDEDLSAVIEQRFDVLSEMTKGIASGNIRSLIVSGAPGVGKTHILNEDLKRAERRGIIERFSALSGDASAIGLYEALWNHREEGNVLILDDIDSIFYDTSSLNVLKKALDSGSSRTITWAKDSRLLKEQDIPKNFDFNGSVVFITNEDFDARIAKRDRLAPHLEALVSRTPYLDLAIHSNRAILLRIKQVVYNTEMLDSRGCDDNDKKEIMDWLSEHRDQVRVLSLRTALDVAAYRKSMSDWRNVAATTLLKPKSML